MPCQRRTLRLADATTLVAEVADRLRAGELCVLPTETVYGLAVLPSHPGAVARARALKGRADQQPFTWHISRREELGRLVASVPGSIQRLLDRYWPGPLTVILPATDGGTAGVRLPAHDFTRTVIARVGEPLWLSSVNRAGEPPLVDAGQIAETFGAELSLVVDDGQSPLGRASTIVRKVGPRLEVLREGILAAEEVLRTAAQIVLFVCSGNTCRSPLAEVLARHAAGKALGIPSADVRACGLDFTSAGTSTLPGMPASEGSQVAAAELGLDLSQHSSRQLDAQLVARASHVYCLAQNHRRAILAEIPQAADKVSLLRPDGLDIGDPYGCDQRAYRRVRDEIKAAVEARLPSWLPLVDS